MPERKKKQPVRRKKKSRTKAATLPTSTSKPATPSGADRFAELAHFTLDPLSVQLLTYHYCTRNNVVVLGNISSEGGAPFTVGMLDTGDRRLIAELEGFLSGPVIPVRLNQYEIQRAIDIGHGRSRAHAGDDPYQLDLKPVGTLSFDPELPVPKMIDQLFGHAVRAGASDIHIETYEKDVDVRIRIDGLLHQLSTPLSRANVIALVSRIKVLARMDIAERRVAQDGRIRANYGRGARKRAIDFRVSCVPGAFGEDMVLRILDSANPFVGLRKLGFTAPILAKFQELVENPEGLVLATGPTGSGKTTTLYSALAHIQTEHKKLLTVEDPIEYVFAKINQKQVSNRMDFAAFARAFMRQDPDIVLIGEIRDEETAEISLRAAQTGHLVLSTLHTNDAVRTISRLVTLDVDRNLVANALLGSLSQRLVRRLCASCKVDATPTSRERRRLFLDSQDRAFFTAPGCTQCNGSGYKGRAGLFELFVVDERVADLIADGTPVHRIRTHARAEGMTTLLMDGLDKARAGVTSLEELLRVVPFRMIAMERAHPTALTA